MNNLIMAVGYFLSSFIPWLIIIYLVYSIIHLIRRKKWKELRHRQILILAVTFSVIATISFLARNWDSHPKKIESKPNFTVQKDSLSIDDKKRFQQIVALVIQEPNSLTVELRREFWSLMKKSGETNPKSIEYLKDLMTGISGKYQKMFYEDAILALNKGTPEKSLARENYEKYLLQIGAITDWRVRENEAIIEKICHQQPVKIGKSELVLNEEMLKVVLSQLDQVSKRIDTLYTNPDSTL